MCLAVIPVIVVSARDPYANRERALTLARRLASQKPVDNDELLAVIRNCLGESNGPQQI